MVYYFVRLSYKLYNQLELEYSLFFSSSVSLSLIKLSY